MGLDTETVRFLLSSRREGASFSRCLTLGRQNYFLANRETEILFQEVGLDAHAFPKLFEERYSRFRYSEAFWEAMGVHHLETLDASAYEGATIVHDLNVPIPANLKERFDAVCDIGTLEHVFNLPQALRNCMEMVAVGGCFFAQTPANNFFGHGFFQFSPELFYRAFSPENGFSVERIVAVEYGPRRRWFEVSDPDKIQARSALINSFPVMLLVRARRVRVVPIFGTAPQQSDCAAQWSSTASPAQSGVVDRLSSSRLDRLKQNLLETAPSVGRFLETLRFSSWVKEWSFRNRKAFRPIPRDKR